MSLVERIIRIRGCGLFGDFKPESDLPDFKKYNLIYGWNGSGKTCFSRILRSFELKENHYGLSEFKFKLKGRDRSISQEDLKAFPNIRVFNSDFIKDNIFGISKPNPIFFLGKASKEKEEQIIQTKEELSALKEQKRKENEELEKSKSNKEYLLSDKAKDIKTNLTTPNGDKYINYNKNNLENKINKKEEDLRKDVRQYMLPEGQIVTLKKAIQQTVRREIDPLPPLDFNISELMEEAAKVLQTDISSQIIEELKSDERINKWVEQGLAIHKERKLEDCAFCNQTIPQGRLEELGHHFNKEYQEVVQRLASLKKGLESKKIKSSFPDASKFYDDLAEKYLCAKNKIEQTVDSFNKSLDSIIGLITEKEDKPFSRIGLEKLKEILEKLKEIDVEPIKTISNCISQHNKKSRNFEEQIREQKEELEMDYIANFSPSYFDMVSEIKETEQRISQLKREAEPKENKVESLKNEIRSHHMPAKQINEGLKNFLGHDDICLVSTEEKGGYQILRNGKEARDLSEGEKTALAIVYFLAKTQEESFDLEKGVIVVDDPVSSLDSSAIFQAFGFIKESIKEAKQIFVLTHHFDFFRQVKNWFFHLGKDEREFFMMICEQEKEKEGPIRKSKIKQIDELLINYESEYHFLFSILYQFATNKEYRLKCVYPIPNIARKFLESFLAFRIPVLGKNSKGSGLYGRLERIDFDPIKKARINRFLDTHSHPRYEAGVLDFDIGVLSETKSVLNDLFELIKSEDEKHYDVLMESMKGR